MMLFHIILDVTQIMPCGDIYEFAEIFGNIDNIEKLMITQFAS